VGRIQLAQDAVQMQELVNTIMNVKIPFKGKNLGQTSKFSFTHKNYDRTS
jgi:hypothetical protein